MKAYHWIPKEFFDEALHDGALHLRHSHMWLADTDTGAYRGCAHKDKPCALLEVDTQHYEIEDHSDMELAQEYGDQYYILRSDKILEEHFELLFVLPPTREEGYADDYDEDDC